MSFDIEGEIESYFDRLWPIMRSITGDGVRETLKILNEKIPMTLHEVATGDKIYDWVVPKEWRFNEAYILAPSGEKIIDTNNNNLHLVNYSTPFSGSINLQELNKHLFSLPDQPNAIPYVTSYYKETWGFCLPHVQRENLPEGEYYVHIDTELFDGSLTFGEVYLPGKLEKEILFSTYICHPSMANNELSGPIVSAFVGDFVSKLKQNRYSYRFLFLPETIGSIVYLSKFGERLKNELVAGYVITCVGDRGGFTFKKSRRGNSISDKIGKFVLSNQEEKYEIRDFFPDIGSDERQYCSPGFNLPVSSIIRSVYGEYNEYHTSLDDKSFISFESMKNSISLCERIVLAMEANSKYISNNQFCEPNLGKRGLYPTLSIKGKNDYLSALFWLVNYSDGEHDLIDIALRSGHNLELLKSIANKCKKKGLFTEVV